jgi:purine nucleosidase
MGGSIKAGGNIDTGIAIGANPNAEWNAYWDPYAVREVLASGLKIDMFPLDVTNQFFLTADVLKQYFLPQAPKSKMMDLASQMYALVAFQAGFSFWDTAAASYLGKPSLFTLASENIDINIDETDSNNFGCIIQNGKYPVNIASATSVPDFYDYLTGQLASIK